MAGAPVVTMRPEVACILPFAAALFPFYISIPKPSVVAIYHHTCAIYFLVRRRKVERGKLHVDPITKQPDVYSGTLHKS